MIDKLKKVTDINPYRLSIGLFLKDRILSKGCVWTLVNQGVLQGTLLGGSPIPLSHVKIFDLFKHHE